MPSPYRVGTDAPRLQIRKLGCRGMVSFVLGTSLVSGRTSTWGRYLTQSLQAAYGPRVHPLSSHHAEAGAGGRPASEPGSLLQNAPSPAPKDGPRASAAVSHPDLPAHLANQASGIKHTKGLDSPWRPVKNCCRLPLILAPSSPGIHLAETALVYHALKSQPVVHLPARAGPTACLPTGCRAGRQLSGQARRASSFPRK